MSLSSLLVLTLPNCSTLQLGVVGATAVDRALGGLEPVRALEVVAGDLEVDERRVAVLGDRAAAPSSGDSTFVTYSAAESSRGRLRDRGLNSGSSTVSVSLWMMTSSSFGLRLGVLERLLGVARLAGEQVGAVDLVLGDGVAEHHGDDDEREPAPDRELAVLGAPMSRPCGKTLGFHRLLIVQAGSFGRIVLDPWFVHDAP